MTNRNPFMTTDNQQKAFSLLHPAVQAAVARLGWRSLRPVQVRTIVAFFNSSSDIVVAAPTASGKTEAAFLPILSDIVKNPEASDQALAISPLKALINDQYGRLCNLAEHLNLPVHRWHGDVPASEKNRVIKNPGGLMIITPESLEARLMRHSDEVPNVFGKLKYVVLDELHAYLREERGAHLASLLSRLQDMIGHRPRRIALSATMGDLRAAKTFLCPDDPETVVLIEEKGHDREIQAMIRSFIQPIYERQT